MLLSKDPSQRPAMASVKDFLDGLVRDREAVDEGLATLGQDGDVVPLEKGAQATTKAEVPPITLSCAPSAAVEKGFEEEKGGEWTDLVSPSAGDGSC